MKVKGVLIGALLFLTVISIMMCMHTETHRTEARAEPQYCGDIRDTIVEYLHVRRHLDCDNTHHTEMAKVHVAEIEALMTFHHMSDCNQQEVFKAIAHHITVCEPCRNYVKCDRTNTPDYPRNPGDT